MSATNTARSSVSGKAHRGAAKKKPAKGLEVVSSQSKAAKARWQPRFDSEEAVKGHFLTCDLNTGLQDLQTLRKHVEIAAIYYDKNQQQGQTERCANPDCKAVFSEGVRWWNRMPVMDQVTRKTHNVYTCSQACYVVVHGKSGNPQSARR